MHCRVVTHKNKICNRFHFKEEDRCYIHIRKWLQLRLKSFNIMIKFPRTLEEIHNGLKLLKYTDPSYEDCYGYNIIHKGIIENNLEQILQGLKIGINVNGRTISQFTPLHLVQNNVQILLHLLKAGANVNAIEYKHHYTPLMIQCLTFHPNKQIIKCLLEWGADLTIKNLSNEKACDNMLLDKKNFNLLTIVDIWNKTECINWRQSILSRFIKRLPHISNKGSLFDALFDHFELSHIFCIQNA